MAIPPVPSIGDSDRYVAYTVVSSTSVFAVPYPVFGGGGDVVVFYNGVEQINNWTFASASGTALAALPLPITDGQVTFGPITSGTLEIIGQWRPRQGILDTSPSLNRREYQQDLGQVVASMREMWTEIWNTFPLSKVGRANAYFGFDSKGNPVAIPFTGAIAPVSSAMAPVIAATTTTAALGIMGFSTYFLTLIGASNLAGFIAALGFSTFGSSLIAAADAAAGRAVLGSTTVGDAIFIAADAAAAMTAQGFSAFFQTLVTSANAAAALTTLGISTYFQTLLGATTGGQVINLIGCGAPKRQTVLAGPVDATTGLPSFLNSTAVSLAITSLNITSGAPFVVAAAGGGASGGANDLVGIAIANLTWSPLTLNATNYLYVTVAANGTLTPGSTTVTPVYQQGGTPAITNGLITFNIGQMIAYLGNGSAANQTYVVLVGEAVTNATTVTSTVMYAYAGRYVSPLGVAIPGTSAQATLAHNLGVPPLGYDLDLRLVCVTGNASYTTGMELAANGGLGIGNLAAVDNHSAAFSTLNAVTIGAAPYGGGASASLTNADWNLRLYATRNF